MTRKTRFDTQVVIITGASSGIGRATALAFAREGTTTVLASRSREKLEEVAEEIHRFNPRVRVLPTDVSSQEQVEAMVHAVATEFGKIDVLVNNAGSAAVGAVDGDRFVEDARHLLDVDFFGKVFCTRAVLPIMRRQGHGAIVNLSSVVGRKAFPRFAAYSAAMHAIAAFSDALRQELRGTGISVSTIHPALTQTAFFEGVDPADIPAPFRRMTPISAEAVARKILKAVVKKLPRVIIPWQPRLLLMGDALSAGFGDRMVRMLQNPVFMALIGMYRGRVYQHASDPRSE
jgi:short-subunit dehydrogenase